MFSLSGIYYYTPSFLDETSQKVVGLRIHIIKTLRGPEVIIGFRSRIGYTVYIETALHCFVLCISSSQAPTACNAVHNAHNQ